MTRGLYLQSVYDLNRALVARATLLMHLFLTDGNILIVMMMMILVMMIMIMIMIMRLIINL